MSEFYEIKSDYQSNIYDFEYMFNEPATEASVKTQEKDEPNINDDANKANMSNKLVVKIKEMIDKILQMIDTAILKFKNSFQKIYLTDKGFKKDLDSWKRDFRPIKSIDLIVYDYSDSNINQVFTHLKGIVNKYISSFDASNLEDDNAILNYTKENIMQDLINNSGIKDNSSVTDGSSLLNEIKKEFRGKKIEKKFMGSQIDQYYSFIDKYKSTKTLLDRELTDTKGKINNMKAKAMILASKTDAPIGAKKKVSIQISKLYYIYNLYASFIRLYFELQVEEMLMYRIIIQRLYQR